MALPPLVRQLVDIKFKNYCLNKIPQEHRDKIKILYRIRGNHVTLIESRPSYFDPTQWSELKVAQFRYNIDNQNWTLYCADRNERWHMYMEINSSDNIDDLINEVDEDPTGIFWG